ncbi:MAG: hypothetical protein ABI791_01730 [Acidobacteriota bacterium]
MTESLSTLAVEAARKIEFEPEIKGGEPTLRVMVVDYPYCYGFWRSCDEIAGSTLAYGDLQSETVIKKAIQNLGGERYLGVKSQIGRGRFSIFKDSVLVSFQTFTDVIVFPEKERTEFKDASGRSVQVNNGSTGWVYDGATEKVRDQDEAQVKSFKQGIRTSLDNLLRGYWHGDAELTYVGKRAATLGKRNDVIKLTYKDGFAVEFEFAADDGLPAKAIYKRTNADGEEVKEEDRYAQFVDIAGVRTPFIIDRFTNGVPSSRINYESVEFNKPIPDSAFAKPASAKDAKRDVKF